MQWSWKRLSTWAVLKAHSVHLTDFRKWSLPAAGIYALKACVLSIIRPPVAQHQSRNETHYVGLYFISFISTNNSAIKNINEVGLMYDIYNARAQFGFAPGGMDQFSQGSQWQPIGLLKLRHVDRVVLGWVQGRRKQIESGGHDIRRKTKCCSSTFKGGWGHIPNDVGATGWVDLQVWALWTWVSSSVWT